MGLAEDLLLQADHLAAYEGANPSQASLRRAVSTAYYALFHLLIEDAGQRWEGPPAARTGLQRAFAHGPMKNTSIRFGGSGWHDWHGKEQLVPTALRKVASAFVDLQEERQAADYDNNEHWSATDVQTIVNTAHSAFLDWRTIRTDPMAGNYLLTMLLPKQRS